MVKHPNQISLEAKQKKLNEQAECNQCLFTQVDDINDNISELSDRLDQLPTANDMFEYRLHLEENRKRCNEMINELKGIVCMARAAVAERKEVSKCYEVKKENPISNDTIRILSEENQHLRQIQNDYRKKLDRLEQKKWWQIWK